MPTALETPGLPNPLRWTRRRALALAAGGIAGALAAATPLQALAQAAPWPNKPVRLVIPFPAGGSTDIVGRLVADKLSQSLNQPFVIDNRAGAGGTTGSDLVAKAPPD